MSSRLISHFFAIRSAPSNCEVHSNRSSYSGGIGWPSSSSFMLDPIGIRLIASTPQPTATSTTPAPTSAAA